PGERRVLTYHDLWRDVNRFANVLKGLGVKRGDRVTIYMPMIPKLPIALLACARIGAVHSVIFGGFSARAIRDRAEDAESHVIVTADGGYRRGTVPPLKKIVDGAIADLDLVKHVVVFRRNGVEVPMRWGDEYPKRHDLSSLRLLGTVGEPINPEAWRWYRRTIGGDRCPIVDTWWQTETGMILITPLPGATTTKPGSATQPFPGIEAEV